MQWEGTGGTGQRLKGSSSQMQAVAGGEHARAFAGSGDDRGLGSPGDEWTRRHERGDPVTAVVRRRGGRWVGG